MLKKCVYYAKGMMKTWLPAILLIVLVSYYFWHSQITSFLAERIEASKKDGIIFYTGGIWDKMKIAKNLQDTRTQRAVELVGGTKTLNDKSGLYSVDIPESWEVILEQGPSGDQVSKIVVENQSFSMRQEGTDIFYENGAQLSIRVVRGQETSAKSADGGHGKDLIKRETIIAGGVKTAYYSYKDPNVKTGELMDAYIPNGGYTYEIKYAFNPRKFDGGEFTFQDILGSLKFRR